MHTNVPVCFYSTALHRELCAGISLTMLMSSEHPKLSCTVCGVANELVRRLKVQFTSLFL